MNSSRKTGVVVGALFILSTLSGILSVYAFGDLLQSDDFLTMFSNNENRIILGTILELLCAGAFVGVAIAIYPILSKFSIRTGIGYLIGRSIEAVPFIISTVCIMAMMTLSREHIQSTSVDRVLYLALGEITGAMRHWANIFGPLIFCGVAALPFYAILWRRNLLPKFISIWGFMATFPYLAAGFLAFWGITTATSIIPVILIVPFAVNEMVLAVWLIVKGFSPAAFSEDSN